MQKSHSNKRTVLPTSEDLRTYARLLKYARPYKWYFLVAIAGMVCFSLSNTGSAVLMKPLLDESNLHEGVIDAWIPLAVVGIVLLRSVGRFLSLYFMGVVTIFTVRRLRNELFAHLLHLPTPFYDAHERGVILARITQIVEAVSSNITKIIVVLVRDSITLISLLVWMFYLNWLLTGIFLLSAPILLKVLQVTKRHFQRISRATYRAMEDLTDTADQAIAGEEVIKSFMGHKHMSRSFEGVNEVFSKNKRRLIRLQAINLSLAILIVGASISFVVYLFTFETIVAWITFGELISFLVAATLVSRPIRGLFNVHSIIHSSLSGARMVFEILDAEPEPRCRELLAEERQRFRGRIEIQDLSMTYARSEHASLSSVSLKIDAGERCALVGRSGAGKSTLVRLLLRFYEPSRGRILLDGVDIQDIDIHVLREQIAYVSQQVVLFHDTIKNNIACRSNIDEERLMRAARQAHVMPFVERLPEGLDTEIGPGRQLLSGGQKQRIALARCLYKDAPVVIFDEATSSLDAESEQVIKNAIREGLKGRTCIMIAHRFSTIRDVDKVIVLDHGQIAQTGTHAELIATEGLYRSLYSQGDGRDAKRGGASSA